MTDMQDVAFPQPARIGQGTAIEQSRAVAEVYAAIMVARQVPRSRATAMRAMEEACATPELAAKAFFAFPRGSKTVEGASIHLARELARCWGNIQYNVSELRRDDEHGQSEMLAFAWDLESNARPSTIFIVPHRRDKADGGGGRLTQMRDIYDNNANAGARRVRECIFAVLPIWFRERAEALCRETAAKGAGGSGKPHAERVANIIKWLETVNVTEQDAARKLERPSNDWTPADLAELGVLLDSIKQGTVTRVEAFPPAVVSGEEIRTASAAVKRPAVEPAGPGEDPAGVVDEAKAWHGEGHPHDGPPPFNRHAWDPECPLCVADDPDNKGRAHYYGHTVDFVEGCDFCALDLAFKEQAEGGTP